MRQFENFKKNRKKFGNNLIKIKQLYKKIPAKGRKAF
jgi:hypothetical protein